MQQLHAHNQQSAQGRRHRQPTPGRYHKPTKPPLVGSCQPWHQTREHVPKRVCQPPIACAVVTCVCMLHAHSRKRFGSAAARAAGPLCSSCTPILGTAAGYGQTENNNAGTATPPVVQRSAPGTAAAAGSRPPRERPQRQDCPTPAPFCGQTDNVCWHTQTHRPRHRTRGARPLCPHTQRQHWRLRRQTLLRCPRLGAHMPPGAACLANQQAPLLPAHSCCECTSSSRWCWRVLQRPEHAPCAPRPSDLVHCQQPPELPQTMRC